jgi:phosphate transport system substrate-binding protein
MKLGTLCILVFACAHLVSCSKNDRAANLPFDDRDLTGTLQVTGSSTMTPMMREIASQFTAQHPRVKINISAGGSGRGISDIRDNKSDIGMLSRLIAEDEQVFKGFPIARDGIGILVHEDNPVKTLSSLQVAKIFSGKITNWRELGGKNAAIIVINRDPGRGATELFMSYFKLKASEIHATATVGENSAVIDMMAAELNGITFFSAIAAEAAHKSARPVKLVLLDGISANRANILTGDYPLTRPLTLVTHELPHGLTKVFIEYCLSSQVTVIIEKMGFVPYEE